MAGRRMRSESPLTTRLPPLNEIGVIPPITACRAPSPAAWPSRPGIAAPSSARLPVGPAGDWTEPTTEDALHSADSAWLTAVSAMGSASRRSNPICAAPACGPNGPFQYRTAARWAFSLSSPVAQRDCCRSARRAWRCEAGLMYAVVHGHCGSAGVMPVRLLPVCCRVAGGSAAGWRRRSCPSRTAWG